MNFDQNLLKLILKATVICVNYFEDKYILVTRVVFLLLNRLGNSILSPSGDTTEKKKKPDINLTLYLPGACIACLEYFTVFNTGVNWGHYSDQ